MSGIEGNISDSDRRIAELDKDIDTVRENIRELIEQAAGYSGAADDELVSQRIAQQEAQLALLVHERDEIARQVN
jgi:hypothetical protein